MSDVQKILNNNRGRTIRDIQNEKKKKRDSDQSKIRIKNNTRTQLIPIQLLGKDKNGSVVGDVRVQSCISIPPGKHADLPAERLMESQITNLKKKGMIQTTRLSSPKQVKEINHKKVESELPKKQVVEKIVDKPSKKTNSKKKSLETNIDHSGNPKSDS